MKKLLAVFLALIMILSVSLVACSDKKDKNTDDNEIEEDDDFVPNNSTQTTAATTGDEEEDPVVKNPPVSDAWVSESGTIYVRAEGVNIRAGARTNATIIGEAKFGDALQYVSYNNEWYKIKYNGTDAYISAAFVNGNQNTVIFEAHATLAAGTAIKVVEGKTCNLRTDPAVANSTLKGSIDSTKTANGELTIVKINKTGTWVEVRFKGTDIEKHTYTGNEVLYCTAEVIAELIGSTNNNPHG